jgi:hypothetical protein
MPYNIRFVIEGAIEARPYSKRPGDDRLIHTKHTKPFSEVSCEFASRLAALQCGKPWLTGRTSFQDV